MTTTLDAGLARAYDAATGHAAVVDRSSRMRVAFTGEKAKETLGGLLTNDVAALATSRGMRAAALTPKGRVIALLRVTDRGDDLLLDADPAAGAGFLEMIRKYVNPRLARHVELTAATGCLGVYGPASATVVANAIGLDVAALDALAAEGNVVAGTGDDAATILRSTDLGVPGFDVIAAGARLQAIDAALEAAGIARGDDRLATLLAIESGVPRWGIEMDGDTLPQEANLDLLGAISFNKGCYTGQEVVARIHFRGHVNRHLRRLVAESAIAEGARVQDAEGKDVGEVRSAATSPARGALALAMLRREVAPGADVVVMGVDARAVRARVEAAA